MTIRKHPLVKRITASSVWRSMFRHGWPDNPLDRSLAMTQNLFLHLHPVKVSLKSIRPSYSFGLGVISIVLFLELTLTGLLLMFYYVPAVEHAHLNIVQLQTEIPFGQLLRNMHRWGAHLMVLVSILHMARVFYTGAYKPPRQFNWVIGVLLLLLTLGASFTGYLLPWDQLSYWAITVGTSILGYLPVLGPIGRKLLLGGAEVGQGALTRFYALHVMIIPITIAVLTSFHIWRVRKDGGLAATEAEEENAESEEEGEDPRFERTGVKTYHLMEVVKAPLTMLEKGPDGTVFAFPLIAIIEMVLALGTMAIILLLSWLRNAPLEELANPLITTDPAKAPWYFMGLQEMLEHMHPLLAGIVLPGILVAFLLALPYIDRSQEHVGRWFSTNSGKRAARWSAIYSAVVIPLFVLADSFFPPREIFRDVLPTIVTQSLIPGVILLTISLMPVIVMWRFGKGKSSVRDILIAQFTFMLIAAVILTIVGFFFRGPGFELYWPWNMPDGYNPLDNL